MLGAYGNSRACVRRPSIRRDHALDAKTLAKLWEFNTNAGVNAPPMTFAVDGKQYVAILVGMGGAWDKWFVELTKGLEKVPPSSMLFVFSL